MPTLAERIGRMFTREAEQDAETYQRGKRGDPTVSDEEMFRIIKGRGQDASTLAADEAIHDEKQRLAEVYAREPELRAAREAAGAKKAGLNQRQLDERLEQGERHKRERAEILAEFESADADWREAVRAGEELKELSRCCDHGPMTTAQLREVEKASVMVGRLVQVYSTGAAEIWGEGDGRLHVIPPHRIHVSPRELIGVAEVRYASVQTDDGWQMCIVGVVKPEVLPAMAG